MNDEYEYEYSLDEHEYLGETGNGSSYTHASRVRTQKEIESLKAWHKPKVHKDVNVESMRAQVKMPYMPPVVNPIMNARVVEFKWPWQLTSNADTQSDFRNRLRTGILDTSIHKFGLWGFETRQEFNNNLHPVDRAQAREYCNKIQFAVAQQSKSQGDHELCYWVAKNDIGTEPGWWAISIDKIGSHRELCIYVNGGIEFFDNLQLSKTNSMRFK